MAHRAHAPLSAPLPQFATYDAVVVGEVLAEREPETAPDEAARG